VRTATPLGRVVSSVSANRRWLEPARPANRGMPAPAVTGSTLRTSSSISSYRAAGQFGSADEPDAAARLGFELFDRRGRDGGDQLHARVGAVLEGAGEDQVPQVRVGVGHAGVQADLVGAPALQHGVEAGAGALTAVAQAAASAGDIDRAERIARSISEPKFQANALKVIMSASSGDKNDHLIVLALRPSEWHTVVSNAVVLVPAMVEIVLAEITAIGRIENWMSVTCTAPRVDA
jgi:hypothetical protein